MTTVSRPYINPSYEQEIDDGCLEYKSIPMAVVKNVIKVEHATNDFTGIKQIYNKVPPRPMNINAMATSIARINNLDYASAVPKIAKQFIDEEVADVNKFVNSSLFERNTGNVIPEQVYTAEKAVSSTTGIPLSPSTNTGNLIFRDYPENLKKENVSLILGDVNPTSGVVPFTTNFSTQTDWIMNRQNLSQNYQKIRKTYGIMSDIAGANPVGFTKSGIEKIQSSRSGGLGFFREGMVSQTDLSKPERGYLTKEDELVKKEKASFYRPNIAYPTKTREVNF
jgi:hypothetical protein